MPTHFIPELGMSFTPAMAQDTGYELLTSSQAEGDTRIFAKRRPAPQFIVTAEHLIVTITSSLQVATYASTLLRKRQP